MKTSSSLIKSHKKLIKDLETQSALWKEEGKSLGYRAFNVNRRAYKVIQFLTKIAYKVTAMRINLSNKLYKKQDDANQEAYMCARLAEKFKEIIQV